MKNLRIVINKENNPKVVKLNQEAIVTLAFEKETGAFNKDAGYSGLYVSINNGETNQFEQDNFNLLGRFIHKGDEVVIDCFTTYIILCEDYTIMN